MTQKACLNINLPKWPALEVVGAKVTRAQAEDIILRTTGLSYFSTNSGEACTKLIEIFFDIKDATRTGTKYPAHSIYDALPIDEADKKLRNTYTRIKSIAEQLEFLQNHQIVSSFIGGPHGWCNWNGTIGCASFNIGKWPSVEDVLLEWKLIAKTFPYLDLTSRLFSGETCEENNKPLVEFIIKNGKAKAQEPKNATNFQTKSLDTANLISRLTSGTNAEIGIDLDKVRLMYNRVSAAQQETTILDI